MLADRVRREPRLDGVSVSSAGTAAWNGAPASEGSLLVGLERGLDLSMHRARALTTAEVRHADVILTMSERHRDRVAELGGAGKAFTFRGFADRSDRAADVPDPFGGNVEAYRSTATVFEELIERIVERLVELRADEASA